MERTIYHLRFFIDGEPVQRSTIQIATALRQQQLEKIRDWQEKVRMHAQKARELNAYEEPWQGTCRVALEFYVSDSRAAGIADLTRPVIDGLAGVVFDSGDQVIQLEARKIGTVDLPQGSRPGVMITVREL